MITALCFVTLFGFLLSQTGHYCRRLNAIGVSQASYRSHTTIGAGASPSVSKTLNNGSIGNPYLTVSVNLLTFTENKMTGEKVC